jgi:hypothetical protein
MSIDTLMRASETVLPLREGQADAGYGFVRSPAKAP